MVNQVYCIYDEKANFFGKPVLFVYDGEAKRAFSDLVLDGNSMVGKHPTDYKFYKLGTYDDVNGRFENLKVPELVCTAIEFVKGEKEGK